MKRIAVFLLASYCYVATASTDVVATISGPVTGTESRDDSIEVFKGIPYAAAPVGALRWRPPAPPERWSHVRKCDQFAARSLQKNERPNQSEDCLYLNIWTARERGAIECALRHDVAVYITVENLEWENRGDLWNYYGENKPGYHSANSKNVEWMDWDGTPHSPTTPSSTNSIRELPRRWSTGRARQSAVGQHRSNPQWRRSGRHINARLP